MIVRMIQGPTTFAIRVVVAVASTTMVTAEHAVRMTMIIVVATMTVVTETTREITTEDHTTGAMRILDTKTQHSDRLFSVCQNRDGIVVCVWLGYFLALSVLLTPCTRIF